MPRFYCPDPLAAGLALSLPAAVAHHLHVLRLAPGTQVTLFNGDGHEYPARIDSIDKRRAAATVLAQVARDAELPYAVTLAQALPEGTKMDWIIEKAVELGVAAVTPLMSERCVVRLSGERADKRRAHWQAVVVAASEQCGRNRLASVAPVAAFDASLRPASAAPAAVRILLSPRATTSLPAWAAATAPGPVTFLIGPEGGFSAREEGAALAAGVLALSMGPRVLRTETAALAAMATLNGIWGGF